MTPEFLAAVIDTLLPGDDVLPSGTRTGMTLAADGHGPVLEAVRTRAGGLQAFARAPEPARVAVLQATERAQPEAFRALLVAVLSDYYEAPAVLTALGWRIDPPQPAGHRVLTPEDLSAGRLTFAQRRGKLWRD